jgi:uncharacterized membrane protein
MKTRTLILQPKKQQEPEIKEEPANLSWPERYTSLIGGAMLSYSGFKNLFGSPLTSIVKIGAGGYMLNRGLTGHCELYSRIDKYTSEPVNINIRSSFVIHKPRHEVYAFWRRLDNLPLFMTHLKSVELLADDRSRWVLKLPTGLNTLTWDAEIVKDKPNEMIGWSSLPGSVLENAGKVRFRDGITGDGTRVDVVITYQPPAGTVGARVARLFNPLFKKIVEKDVQNFKHYMDIDYAEDMVNYI